MEIGSKMETSQNTYHDPDFCSAEDSMEECWPSGATDAVPEGDFWYEAWVPNANQISLTYRSKTTETSCDQKADIQADNSQEIDLFRQPELQYSMPRSRPSAIMTSEDHIKTLGRHVTCVLNIHRQNGSKPNNKWHNCDIAPIGLGYVVK